MSTPADPADDDPDQRRLFSPNFIVLLLIGLAHGFAFSTFFLLPKYLATELGAGPELIGRITAAAGIAGVFTIPLLGFRIDRTSRRGLIALGAALQVLAALGFIWVDTVGPLVFLLRAIQGVGFSIVFNAVSTLAADLAPPKRLGQAIGIIGVSAVCMNAIAPAVTEPLAHRAGWQPVFALAAGAAVLAALLTLALREREITATGPSSFKHVFAGRSVAIYYVSAVAGAAFGTMFTFVPAFAITLGVRAVSTFFVAYTLIVITVRLTLGSVADRWGRQRVALVALTLYGTATLAAGFLRPGGLELLGALFGVAHGLFYPALNAFAVEEVPSDQRGGVMTFFNGSFNAGFAAGVVVLGALAQYAGYSTAFVTMALFTGTAVLTLLMVPAPAPLSERLQPDSTRSEVS